MLQLLTKDIRISKKYLLLGFIGIGVSLFLLSDAFEGLPLALPAALFSYVFIVTTSKSDEKNNNGRMLASLPLRRRDIVNAKYGGILMFTALAFLMTLFWRVFAFIIFPEADITWFSSHSIYITLIILFVYFAIYFPIFFAFGSRIIQILEYIVAVVLLVTPLIFLRYLGDPEIILDNLSLGNTPFWVGGICLVIVFVSWLISIFVYERRNI